MARYVRNAWYVACWADDLEAAQPLGVHILGDRIVLWRSGAHVVALEDRCAHRLAPLSLGQCEGKRLRCMYHGLLFDAAGKVVEIPGQDRVPKGAGVRAYPAVERHSWIWVWMGEAAAADPDLIPQAIGLDHADWNFGHGQMNYEAEARLINDNLLDFSHLSFVHSSSFAPGSSFAEEHPSMTVLARGIRFAQWTPGRNWRVPGPGNDTGDQIVDRWMTYDFVFPGVLTMWSANFPVGTAAALDGQAPDRACATSGVVWSSQAVTPLDARHARYYYSRGVHRAFGNDAARDMLMRTAGLAFEEDRVIIEAQQRVIDEAPEMRIMPTAHDRAVTIFNRLVEKLAKLEEDGVPAEA